ncbi:retrovirus-related pol polyprotein from transposon TNT 1-94, partial [Tanacetum coccineum]
ANGANARVWLANYVIGTEPRQQWALYGDGTIRLYSDCTLCVTSNGHESLDNIILLKCQGVMCLFKKSFCISLQGILTKTGWHSNAYGFHSMHASKYLFAAIDSDWHTDSLKNWQSFRIVSLISLTQSLWDDHYDNNCEGELHGSIPFCWADSVPSNQLLRLSIEEPLSGGLRGNSISPKGVTKALRLKLNAFKSLEGEKVNGTFTRLKCLLNDLENNGVTIPQAEVNATFDSDSDVEEDQRTNNEFMADLNVEYHERALLANQKRFYKRSGRVGSARKPLDKTKETCFACGKLGHFQKDYYKGKYKGLKAKMAILTKRIDDMTKGKSEKGKKDKEKSEKGLLTESFDWDDESVSSDDEGSTKISDEPSVGKVDARSGQWADITIKKGSKEKLVSRNIVKALGGKGIRKEKISSKEVIFTKADEPLSTLAAEITSDLEYECESHEPLPPLPKLIGAIPSGTSESLISLSDLTLNMANLTLDTLEPKKTRPSAKVSPAYVIKKKIEKSSSGSKPCSDKKTYSSTEQLLLTLIEEVKGLKRQIKIPSGTPPSSTQPSSSKASKQKTWFGPCKHYGFRNHLSDDCYSRPKCSTYGSTDHLSKEHLEHAAVKKTLIKLKAQSHPKPLPKKTYMIPKPFIE